MSVTILGIESSCDDTSSSVIRDGVMLSNVIASQAVHEAYGGVVPELASRAHQQNIIPVVAEAIKRAGIDIFAWKHNTIPIPPTKPTGLRLSYVREKNIIAPVFINSVQNNR